MDPLERRLRGDVPTPAGSAQPCVTSGVPGRHASSSHVGIDGKFPVAINTHTPIIKVQSLGAQKLHFPAYGNASKFGETVKMMPPDRTRDADGVQVALRSPVPGFPPAPLHPCPSYLDP